MKVYVRSTLSYFQTREARDSATNRFTSLLFEQALYNRESFSEEDFDFVLESLYNDGLRVDSWCVECGRSTTWVLTPLLPNAEALKVSANELRKLGQEALSANVEEERIHEDLRWLEFRCARRDYHKLIFVIVCDRRLDLDAKSFSVHARKIGQLPSPADIAQAEARKYRNAFPDNDLFREFCRAIGLASHDVGIGSFVYLRRIFERLVNEAIELAAPNDAEAQERLRKLRMDEKITALREHLPAFLVENSALYKILSVGIHELSEEECLGAFSVVKLGIELILDERLARKEREQKIQDAAKLIQGLHASLKGTE